MQRERHDIAGGRGRVTVELAFDAQGRIVGLAVPDAILRDEASARLAQRLERLGRRIAAEGLGAVVTEALIWWQLAAHLQLIERARIRGSAAP